MSLDWSPIGDFIAVADGLRTVTIKPRDGSNYTVADGALFGQLSIREVGNSNGYYRAQDVRIHLPCASVETIVPGDSVQDLSLTDYVVLTAHKSTLLDRWECVCRDLVAAENLNTLVTIQVATTAKGDSGAHEQSWSNLLTEVRANIVRVSATRDDTHGGITNQRRYIMLLREVLDLRRKHRVVGPDSVVYEVLSYSDPEAIGKPSTVELQRWR